MTGTANHSERPPVLVSEADVLAFVGETADGIYDPCSMAIGLNVGLVEMGLVRRITASPLDDGWDVAVQIRLTSPGCQYYFYFQEELEARLLDNPAIAKASVTWDPRLDWTPEDMAASAREKIEGRIRLFPVITTESR